jgi:hypothetical protein
MQANKSAHQSHSVLYKHFSCYPFHCHIFIWLTSTPIYKLINTSRVYENLWWDFLNFSGKKFTFSGNDFQIWYHISNVHKAHNTSLLGVKGLNFWHVCLILVLVYKSMPLWLKDENRCQNLTLCKDLKDEHIWGMVWRTTFNKQKMNIFWVGTAGFISYEDS